MLNDGFAPRLNVWLGPAAEAGLGRDLNHIRCSLGLLPEYQREKEGSV